MNASSYDSVLSSCIGFDDPPAQSMQQAWSKIRSVRPNGPSAGFCAGRAVSMRPAARNVGRHHLRAHDLVLSAMGMVMAA